MAKNKEPEQILEQVFDLLAQLEKIKVKAVRPIPIVKDREGRLAKDLTIKEWFAKINEEVDELKDAVLGYYTMINKPGCFINAPTDNEFDLIVGELCDVIEVLYSMANQMGIDGDMIQQGIANTNKKLKERGCI